MKFLVPNTFRSTMTPMTMIGWLFGIGIIEYPVGRPRRILSACWALTNIAVFWILIGISYRFRYTTSTAQVEQSELNKATYITIMVCDAFVGLVIIYDGQAKSTRLVQCYKQIDTVNEMLNNIGISREYGLTLRSHIFQIIAFLLFVLLPMSIIDCVWVYQYNNSTLGKYLMFASAYHIFLTTCVNNFCFSNTLRYIRNRFRHLNAYFATRFNEQDRTSFDPASNQDIPCIQTVEASVQSRRDRKSHERRMIAALLDAKKIYQDLFRIAGSLNDVFGIYVLFSVARSFIVVITILHGVVTNNIFGGLGDSQLLLFVLPIVLRCVVCTISIIHFFSIASTIADETQLTADLINKLITPTTSNEMREEIQGFSLRIMYEPLQFTANGFFTLDRAMLTTMAGCVATYLVIMIQLGGTATTNDAAGALNSSY